MTINDPNKTMRDMISELKDELINKDKLEKFIRFELGNSRILNAPIMNYKEDPFDIKSFYRDDMASSLFDGLSQKGLYTLIDIYVNHKFKQDIAKEKNIKSTSYITTLEHKELVRIYFNILKLFALDDPSLFLRLDIHAFEGEGPNYFERGSFIVLMNYIRRRYSAMGLYNEDKGYSRFYIKPIYFCEFQNVYFDIKKKDLSIYRIRGLGEAKFKDITKVMEYYCKLFTGDPNTKIYSDDIIIPDVVY